MKEKIIKYTKIILFITMIVLSFIASAKIADYILVLDKEIFTRAINVILVVVLVGAFCFDKKTKKIEKK